MPPFDFTRLGVRIPCVMVSPWIPKGTVVHSPQIKPYNTSQFELSSIPATVKRMFNLPHFLTKRDEWAAPFDYILSEPAPRKDCLKDLPQVPQMSDEELRIEGRRKLNDLQKSYVKLISEMLNEDVPFEKMNQEQGGIYVRDATKRYINKVTKKNKRNKKFKLI